MLKTEREVVVVTREAKVLIPERLSSSASSIDWPVIDFWEKTSPSLYSAKKSQSITGKNDLPLRYRVSSLVSPLLTISLSLRVFLFPRIESRHRIDKIHRLSSSTTHDHWHFSRECIVLFIGTSSEMTCFWSWLPRYSSCLFISNLCYRSGPVFLHLSMSLYMKLDAPSLVISMDLTSSFWSKCSTSYVLGMNASVQTSQGSLLQKQKFCLVSCLLSFCFEHDFLQQLW
jgi:hypothetical protein